MCEKVVDADVLRGGCIVASHVWCRSSLARALRQPSLVVAQCIFHGRLFVDLCAKGVIGEERHPNQLHDEGGDRAGEGEGRITKSGK